MQQYIVIGEQSYEIEGSEALEIAIAALEAAGDESARIYNGDPEDPSSYATQYFLHVDGTKRMSAGV